MKINERPNVLSKAQLMVFTSLRFLMSVNTRLVYPLLSTISLGLDVSISTLSMGISIRSLFGILNPFLSSMADYYGRKSVVLAGIGMVLGGLIIFIVHPIFLTFVIYLCLSYLGTFGSMAALQAYVTDNTPSNKSGRNIAIMELGWSTSFIFGMPIVALIIANYGWKAPFPIIILMIVAVSIFLFKMMKNEKLSVNRPQGNWLFGIGKVFANKQTRMILYLNFMLMIPSEMILMVFGPWLETSFHVKILTLGLSSLVIGLAEFCGENLSAGITDWLGGKKALSIGLVGNTAVICLLPVIGKTPVYAIIGLFFFFIFIEFAYISGIPLVAESIPESRATVLGVNGAGIALSRSLVALVAPMLLVGGLGYVVFACVLTNLVALFLLKYIHERRELESNFKNS